MSAIPVPPLPGAAAVSAAVPSVPSAPMPTTPVAPTPAQGNVPPAAAATPPAQGSVPPAAAATAPAPAPAPATPGLPKSCETCVFFIASGNTELQEKILNRPASGGAICGKFSRFLTTVNTEMDRPHVSRELSALANKCPSYQRTDTSSGNNVSPEIFLGNITATPVQFGPGRVYHASTGVSTCRTCVFYRADKDAFTPTNGIIANVCTLKRLAIPNGNAEEVGAACDSSVSIGSQEANNVDSALYSIELDPHLDNNRGLADWEKELLEGEEETGNNTPGKKRATKKDDQLDPASDDDKMDGIVGWRRIYDQGNSERYALVPVFDPKHFEPEWRSMIPMTGDDSHPENYIDHQNVAYRVAQLWKRGMTPAINGIPGTGKTEFFKYMAWLMQMPFVRISVTGSMELDELAGSKEASPEKGTYFEYGILSRAYSEPSIICIDEPNTGSNDVWQFLRPLTDNSKQLMLTMNKAEIIVKNKHCYLGMAFNPSWDMRNAGTRDLAAADVSRLHHISLPAPAENVERKIIKKACRDEAGFDIDPNTLDKIMKIAKDIRELAPQDFPVHWAVREQLKVALVSDVFDLRDCYKMAVADFLEPDDAEQILQIVKSYDTEIPRAGNNDTGKKRGRPRMPRDQYGNIIRP
ncbi:AAA-ATPase [Gordonia phage Jumbo]|uniref:AAA-ATPase n=1 Tax=Gordonia phage Jumbo TaxID=1887650 RepID=A0A1B3B0T1_9CAUD|nr:ATPase [Gordonia phage Jumbo]AOE44601.1 AAA-ATPase [Gordonia phage Jumbo]